MLYKNLKKINKLIPLNRVVVLLMCFGWNQLIYMGTQHLLKHAQHYDLTTGFDRSVPFVSAWIYIYLICFLFWIINYLLVARDEKDRFYRFVTADMLAKLICGVIFILLPTTNIRPEVTGHMLSDLLVRFVYRVDLPYNLFPSIHCLVSWLCYIGVRGRKRIPRWYRLFSCIFALLVCFSTQFTKQHYIVDLAAGIFLAEASYFIVSHTGLYKKLEYLGEHLPGSIFREEAV